MEAMKKIILAICSALAFSLMIPDVYAQTQRTDTMKYPPKTNYNNTPGGTGADTQNGTNRNNNRTNDNRNMNNNGNRNNGNRNNTNRSNSVTNNLNTNNPGNNNNNNNSNNKTTDSPGTYNK
jgi:hypothetical protein